MISQHAAWADVWGWADAQGTAHFASEKLDARYQIFFREGESYDTREIAAGGVPAGSSAPGAAATPGPGSAGRMARFIDGSAGYKAVRLPLRSASQTHGIDYELLQALIVTESGFNAGAVSPKGAVGLMQVMPATAERYGVVADARTPVAQKLADPVTNIRAGSRYLRYLLDLFPGQIELALAAYNAGEGAVQRAGNRVPAYPETRNYVKTVLQIYRLLKPESATAELQGAGRAPQRVRMEIPGRIAGRGNLPASELRVAAASTETPVAGAASHADDRARP